MRIAKRKKLFKIGLILLILALSFLILRFVSLNQIRQGVEQFGAKGPIIYILFFSLLPIFFFPVPILALVSGIIFGVFYGTFYTVIGACINTSIMYVLGRYIGKDYLTVLINRKFSKSMRNRLMTKNQYHLFTIFFILRLVPLVSYNFINYIAGLTEIRFSTYLFATILGIIPGTIIFLNVGDKSLDMRTNSFYISIALLIILMIFSVILLRIYFKKGNYGNDHHTNISRNSKY